MNRGRCVCGVIIAFSLAGEAQAQFVGPGLGYGAGFGFQRRNLVVGGFFGGGYAPYGPYALVPAGPFYPFAPYGGGYKQVTIIIPPPVLVQSAGQRRQIAPEPEYDLSGVDLDLVSPDDLLKPRAELERIMAENKRLLALQPRKRVAPPADMPPPARKPPDIKKPAPPPRPPEEIRPGEEYKRLLELGQEAFQRQFYGIAAQRFAQAAKFDPAKSTPYFLLSQAKFALGKYAEAVRAVEQGMRVRNDWPLAKFQTPAELYKGNDDYVVHLKRLEDALAADPKNADFLFLVGHQLWFAGFRERAAEVFRRARPLAVDPAFIDAFLRVAPAKVAAN